MLGSVGARGGCRDRRDHALESNERKFHKVMWDARLSPYLWAWIL